MRRLLAVALVLVSGCSADKSPERFEQGRAAMEAKDYDLAISCYSDYIKARPQEAKGYAGRAHAYQGKRMYKEAIADFTEAIKLDPNNPGLYNSRGLAHMESPHTKDPDLMHRDFEKSKALSKKQPD